MTPLRTNAFKKPMLIWFVVALFYCYENFLQISHSVLPLEFTKNFHLTASSIGMLSAIYFSFYTLLQIPVGLIYDHYGVKRPFIAAIFACALGALLFSYTHSYIGLLIARGLIGAGSAFAPLGSLEIAGLWFSRYKFAFLTGLLLSIGMFGQVLAQAPLASLFTVISWRNGYFMFSIFGVFLILIIALIVPDKRKKTGLTKQKKTSIFKELKFVFACSQTWLLGLFSMLVFTPFLIYTNVYGIEYLKLSVHASTQQASIILSSLQLGFAIGAPLIGAFSDWSHKRLPSLYLGCYGTLICSLILLYGMHTPLIASACLFMSGFFISGFLPAFTAAKERHNEHIRATTLGFMNTLNMLGGVAFIPIIGIILDKTWDHTLNHGVRVYSNANYTHALLIVPAMLTIACILLFFIKETGGKKEVLEG
jgi:MFS family permease